jgi:TPP-dependent 2-oxoacid decarboxylase
MCSHSFSSYEIERQIHGPKAEYNDIMMYDWQKMLPFFAGKSVSNNGLERNSRSQTEACILHRPTLTNLSRFILRPNWMNS